MHWFALRFTFSELFLCILLLFGFLSCLAGVLSFSLAIGLMDRAEWLGPNHVLKLTRMLRTLVHNTPPLYAQNFYSSQPLSL